jgi:hypothetical protein
MKLLTGSPETELRTLTLACRYRDANIAVAMARANTPASTAAQRELLIATKLMAHHAALVALGDSCRAQMDAAFTDWLARDNAERDRLESATPPVAHDEPWECVIMCRKSSHCQGCDQCQDSTRERIAHVRRPSTAVPLQPVRYCDDCAATVNAGEHDVYDRVKDALTVADATGVSQ